MLRSFKTLGFIKYISTENLVKYIWRFNLARFPLKGEAGRLSALEHSSLLHISYWINMIQALNMHIKPQEQTNHNSLLLYRTVTLTMVEQFPENLHLSQLPDQKKRNKLPCIFLNSSFDTEEQC